MGGVIDLITPEGTIEGWCWNGDIPDFKTTAIIAVDGVEAARVVADLYREDLKHANVGDGHHAFRCVIPLAMLESRREHRITLTDSSTGKLTSVFVYRSPQLSSFDDRLEALETSTALLEGRLKELHTTSVSEASAAELFAVVGVFFERLAQDVANGEPVKPERQLADSIRAISKIHHPIIIPITCNPVLAIVIECTGSLSQVYDCLNGVRRSFARIEIVVTILDAGRYPDVALISSIVRGVRYIRTNRSFVQEWIEAAELDNAPLILSLSSHMLIDGHFISPVLRWLDDHPRTGAIGPRHANFDGSIQHLGLYVSDGTLAESTHGNLSASDNERLPCHPVHALFHQAAMFRRAAYQSVEGLDPAFGDDLWAAIVDLSLRIRENGWTIVCEPGARVRMLSRESVKQENHAQHSFPAQDMLESRWLTATRTLRPLVVGSAIVLHNPDMLQSEIDAIRLLREADYSVTCIHGRLPLTEHFSNTLRAAGASVCQATMIDVHAQSLIYGTSPDGSEVVHMEELGIDSIIVGLVNLKKFLASGGPPGESAK